MASSPADLPIRHFTARDGTRLAWRETGQGRPLVLIHGYFSNAFVNWIRYGHAAKIAEAALTDRSKAVGALTGSDQGRS